MLIPLHNMLLGQELRSQLAHSPALWLTFGSLAAGHFWKAFQSGYDVMSENQLKQRARWDVYLPGAARGRGVCDGCARSLRSSWYR